MSRQLEREFQYYLLHQDEMVEKYDGKYIAIKDDQVVGVYESDFTAVTEMQKDHELGTFLVQKVSAGDTNYAQTFHSGTVVFP